MPNVSTAKGTFTFNFSNVEKVTPAKVTTWIRKFMLALELQEYKTVFENSLPNRAFTGAEIKAPISLNFTADGHYAFDILPALKDGDSYKFPRFA